VEDLSAGVSVWQNELASAGKVQDCEAAIW